MLKLSGSFPFAKGSKRACYLHPTDPNYCVKILRQDAQPRRLREKEPWFRRVLPLTKFDSNHQELVNLKRIHQRIGGTHVMLVPGTQGYIETDLGRGLLVELIRNSDGSICKTLQAHVRQHGFSDQVSDALNRLTIKMLELRIQLKDPGTNNIICQIQSTGSLECMLVDGFVAKSASFPASITVPVTRLKIRAKMDKVRHRLGG